MKHILAIDQGTTGTTAMIIDGQSYKVLAKFNQEFSQIYPAPGQVEHNLDEIWGTIKMTVHEVLRLADIQSTDISEIGITNQRETTCAFDKNGNALAHAIVWQDRRTSEYCGDLRAKGYSETFRTKTGLPIDPYFSGTKMHWLLKHNEHVKSAAKTGNLKFGTIDTFILYKLSGNQSHKTESSNASRTLLMNLDGHWDDELLAILEVDKNFLPAIHDSFGLFGHTKGLSFLPDGIPITGILGDQQAALFGQGCLNQGEMKCTYGTGAFMLLNTGEDRMFSKNGLLTTVAYRYQGKNIYALEGSCYIAGAAVQWLRDNLEFFPDSPAIENRARAVTDLNEMEHVLFLPFFTGMGSPHWKSEAKGAIIGLTRDTNKNHISRACLDGIALSINDLISAMEDDTALKVESLRVDGGAVANNLLMEIQATISKLKVIRPKVIETTAYGAALAAAVGNGKTSLHKVVDLWAYDREFHPQGELIALYDKKRASWQKAIKLLYLNQ